MEGRIELTPRLVTGAMSRVLDRSVVAYRYAVITRDKRSGREEGMFALDDLEGIGW